MDDCPLCFSQLKHDKVRTDTMLVNHTYEVYSCVDCSYVVDFTIENQSIRPSVIAAAYRRMAEDLQKLHRGEPIPESRKLCYSRFVKSREFKDHTKIWESQSANFWIQTKDLLFWVIND